MSFDSRRGLTGGEEGESERVDEAADVSSCRLRWLRLLMLTF